MKILALVVFLTVVIIPQKKDPGKILNDVINNFNQVRDYEVDVNIKVDVEFLKVPESNARIYFKQPDRIALESDGFAMLPKNGFNFSPNSLLKGDYTAIFENEEVVGKNNLSVVKVIPLGSESEVILSTLWIDEARRLIRKVESTTKTNGTFNIDFDYNDKLKYPLPTQMVFSFNIDKMNFPTGMLGDTDNNKKKSKLPGDSLTRGKVVVRYSDYIVNKGIPDSVFDEKK